MKIADGNSGVVIVGSIMFDVTAFAQVLPRSGQTLVGEELILSLGGKGANQAVAALKAGTPTTLIGAVGQDAFADNVIAELTGYGLQTEYISRLPGGTGVAHIRVGADGENTIVIFPAANERLKNEQILGSLTALPSPPAVVLCQLEITAEATGFALQQGQQLGALTVLDPAPSRDIAPEVWSYVDVAVPNESEAEKYSGIAVTSTASAIAAGQWFLDRGVKHVVMTLGAQGVLLVEQGRSEHFPAPKVNAIDTTAAGDTFAGYFAALMARGESLEQALDVAVQASALAVQAKGAARSIPDIQNVLGDVFS